MLRIYFFIHILFIINSEICVVAQRAVRNRMPWVKPGFIICFNMLKTKTVDTKDKGDMKPKKNNLYWIWKLWRVWSNCAIVTRIIYNSPVYWSGWQKQTWLKSRNSTIWYNVFHYLLYGLTSLSGWACSRGSPTPTLLMGLTRNM